MYLHSLRIRGLRGIADATVRFDRGLTALVGENNGGKSTVLDAVAAVLSYRRPRVPFDEGDFRLAGGERDIRDAPPIQLDLEVRPDEAAFAPGSLRELRPLRDSSGEFIRLRLTCRYDADPAARSLATTLRELRADDQELPRDLPSFPLARDLPVETFGHARSVEHGTNGRWTHWGRLKADIRPSGDLTEEVLAILRDANTRIVEGTPVLSQLSANLSQLIRSIGFAADGGVRLGVAPFEAADLLDDLRLELVSGGTGRHLDAAKHGLGTQSALLFAIYRRLVQREIDAAGGAMRPILLIEEPEAHLHPTAQRAFAGELRKLGGQVILTTHSPDLVKTLGWENVVMMRAGVGGSAAYQVTAEPHRESRARMHALFARCVLLCEGSGEAAAAEVFARALGIDLHAIGVELCDAGGGNNVTPLFEAFCGLSLPSVVLVDHDLDQIPARLRRAAERLGRRAEGSDVEAALAANDCFLPPRPQKLEAALVEVDAASVGAALSAAGVSVDVSDRTALTRAFSEHGKHLVREVARRMTVDGADASRIPTYFRKALLRAAALAAR